MHVYVSKCLNQSAIYQPWPPVNNDYEFHMYFGSSFALDSIASWLPVSGCLPFPVIAKASQKLLIVRVCVEQFNSELFRCLREASVKLGVMRKVYCLLSDYFIPAAVVAVVGGGGVVDLAGY